MDIATGVQKARRFVASLSIVTLLASFAVSGVAQAATYTDVPADAWFYTYVEQLAAAGILDTTQTMYRPADLANRAEAAKLLVEAAGLTIDTSAGPSFKDVAPGAWYYQYVETAAKNGVVSGYKDTAGNLTGNFGPGDSVTREQFAKMAVNAMAMTSDTTGGPHFPDVGTDRWSYSFIETLYNNSVVDGYPDGTFGPGKNINRAEIAKMVVGAMNPVPRGSSGAFNAQTASATSATMVDVMFSQDVDPTTGADPANYSIMDANNNTLAVTAASVSADTVTLTTASQTANRPYTLTVTGVMSASGKALDNGIVNFNGYNPLGVGGPLTVALDPNTPAAMAAPKGASGIVFTCWDFSAGSDATVVQSLVVHRSGPGSQGDFSNVYLYNDAARLTTGRTINSETQNVEFNNINVSVAAGGMAKLCVVADLSVGAQGAAQHSFGLDAVTAITTNASSVGGSFPLYGNLMTVAGGTVGTATLTANGSLDEITVGQQQARISQFQIEMDGSEDANLQRIALYVRGSIRPTDLSNLKLYSEDNATTPIATVDSITTNSLATFVPTAPYKIGRGQRKIFFVTADVKGRNGDDIKTYLDETTDLLMVGSTFGFGEQVNTAGFDGSAPANFSDVTVKGSAFNIAFNGPSAGDIAIGQQTAHCLDLTITNQAGDDVDIKDWKVNLAITSAVGPLNGLIDNTAGTANYTLIKLAEINSDGTLGGTLLGSNELSTAGSDSSQDVILSGDATIHSGESINAAVTVNVASNAAMDGDQLKCTLLNLVGQSDAVRDVNGDQLGANSITPNADIAGNLFNVSASGLTINLATTPTTQTYTRGTNDAALVGLALTSGSSLDNTLKSITLTGYVDNNQDGTFVAGAENGVQANNIVDNSVALYDGTTKISDFKNINAADGTVVFNNLNLVVPKGQTLNLTLKGHISNSAPFAPTGVTGNDIKFALTSNTNVTAIDQNGQTVASSAIVTNAQNGGLGAGSVVMTVAGSGSGTVATSSSSNSAALAGAQQVEVGRWTFTSVNENPTLKDMQFAVESTSGSTISNVKLYKNPNANLCGGGTQVGSVSGYVPTPVGTGAVVKITDLNEAVTSNATYTLCALATTGTVNTDGTTQPLSGSNIGLALLNLTKVTSGAGENIAPKYAGDLDPATTGVQTSALNVAMTTTLTAGHSTENIEFANPSTLTFTAGDVFNVDNEVMFYNGANVSTDPAVLPAANVIRGFANSVVASHNIGATVTRSTIAVASPAGTDVVQGDMYSNAAGTGYSLCVDPTLGGSTTVCDNAADTVVPVLGTGAAFLPAAGSARFPLHGNLSKLFRSIPQVANLVPVGAPAVSPNSNTVLLDMNVTAVGDQVKFAANGNVSNTAATIAGLSVDSGNQLVMKLSGNVALNASTCRLDKVTGGTQTLATVATAGGATEFVAFEFDTNGLTIANGTTVELQAICDTSTMVPSAGGNQVSASVVSDPLSLEWSDNVQQDILGAGAYIFQTAMQGYTAKVTT